MELGFILKKLQEQLIWLQHSNLDIWLPTTYPYIEEYFGFASTRANYFKSIMKEYEDKKGSRSSGMGLTLINYDSVKNKAKAFLSEVIEIIEHDIEQKDKEEKANQEKEKRHQENLARLAAIPKTQTQFVLEQKPPPEPKVVYKTRLPFGINVVAFWSAISGIFITACTFSYWLGTRWENLELHEQNRDLKEQVKKLEEDTTTMGTKINEIKLYKPTDTATVSDSTRKIMLPDSTKVLPNTKANNTKKKSSPKKKWYNYKPPEGY